MSLKRGTSSSKGSDKPKKARKVVTLETKLAILKKLEEGMRVKDIAGSFDMAATTVVTIRKDRDKIIASAKHATPLSAKIVTKHRPAIMEDMERLLSLWVDDMCSRDDSPMTNKAIQEKALSLYEDLLVRDTETAGPSGSASHPPFHASKGWLSNFKQRFSLHSVKQTGEAASADKAAASDYLPVFLDIIAKGGYTAQQVFNADETGLYWKRMPTKTVISRNEKKAPGHKASKDRVSLLFGGNAAGDFKLKPVLIHHSENPRALKGHTKASLPVIFRSSKRGWMNSHTFQVWFTDHFCPAVERYCHEKNLAHKALLLVDNAPSHPKNLSYMSENVRVEFIPKNTTALLQPMDQGIIATFKAYYLRRTFKKMIEAVDTNESLSITQFWKQFNIKDGIDIIAESWNEVKESTMNAVWKKIWPECVHNFAGFPQVCPVVTEVVSLAHKAGMEEVDEEDVNELLTSHEQELTNEELIAIEQERAVEEEAAAAEEDDATRQHHLTRKILAEALSEIESGMRKIVDNDPNRERSLKLERNIQYALAAYKQLYQEKLLQARQTRLTSFFSVTSAPADASSTTAATSASPTADTADDFLDISEAILLSSAQDDDDDNDADSPRAYLSTLPSTQ